MFSIGEFSKIAQTPVSQLRYYDQIGLFQPAYTDRFTKYRYYRANQLPDLNRILALKELGLSLDQIKRMVLEEVSVDEIRGMLALRKAQAEQAIRDELNRVRIIEARLNQVDSHGAPFEDDVIFKSLPEMHFLSTRRTLDDIFDGVSVLQDLMAVIPSQVPKRQLGHPAAVVHGDAFQMANADIEIGYFLNGAFERPLLLPGGQEVTMRVIPEEPHVISAVRVGPFENGFDSYAKLGRWVEKHHFRIIGPVREVFIELPPFESGEPPVVEIQIPVSEIHDRLPA